MSKKKYHEVDRLASVVFDVAEQQSAQVIVDVGSGSGYLTHQLAKKYPVIAIDCDPEQTLHSIQREEDNDSPQPVMHLTLFLNAENLTSVLKSISLDDNGKLVRGPGKRPRFLITALHACGDLSTRTILDTYKNLAEICSIVTVGCCYQMLTTSGFPLSENIKKRTDRYDSMKYPFFGRPIEDLSPDLLQPTYRLLNTACQTVVNFSPQRILDTWRSFAYRSLIESLLESKGCVLEKQTQDLKAKSDGEPLKRIGILSPKAFSKGFHHYSSIVSERVQVPLSSEEIESHLEKYDLDQLKTRIGFMCAIRLLLGPCMESLLLLDRLWYLEEEEEGESTFCTKLINLFDYQQSPRNMALISYRN
jgi:hypothetical protein